MIQWTCAVATQFTRYNTKSLEARSSDDIQRNKQTTVHIQIPQSATHGISRNAVTQCIHNRKSYLITGLVLVSCCSSCCYCSSSLLSPELTSVFVLVRYQGCLGSARALLANCVAPCAPQTASCLFRGCRSSACSSSYSKPWASCVLWPLFALPQPQIRVLFAHLGKDLIVAL